jgi:hypothetical protein
VQHREKLATHPEAPGVPVDAPQLAARRRSSSMLATSRSAVCAA